MIYNHSDTPQWGSNSDYRVPKSYKSLDEALMIARQSVQGEKEDELFYDYLISVAPTSEEKDIITGIRDDERKHGQMFRGIYKAYTGENIPPPKDVDFERPKSYIDGIRKAFFGELNAMERYRIVRAGLPDRYYRDMVFEILTDEMEHADKYNYILNLNIEKAPIGGMTFESSVPKSKTKFTPQEAAQIARAIGIDFSREKFDLNQFTMGVNTELEHGRRNPLTNVTGDDPLTTGKIALAHLSEFPDYYTRLAKLEQEAKAYWSTRNSNMYRTVEKELTPDEWVRYIDPLVRRGLAEMAEGINMEHLFQEFILSGVLVGRGLTPQAAIEQVEKWEKTGESQLLAASKMKPLQR